MSIIPWPASKTCRSSRPSSQSASHNPKSAGSCTASAGLPAAFCDSGTQAKSARLRKNAVPGARIRAITPIICGTSFMGRQDNGKSNPMIGVARGDLLRPIDLFGNQAAHQHMRPGHGPQRQAQIAASQQLLVEPVGAADQEGKLGMPALAPAGQLLGKAGGIERLAMLVEGD